MLHEVREEPRLALPRFGVPAAESVSSGEPPRFVQQIIRARWRQFALFLRLPAPQLRAKPALAEKFARLIIATSLVDWRRISFSITAE